MTDENTRLITPPSGDHLCPDSEGVRAKPEEEGSSFNWGFFLVALLGSILLRLLSPLSKADKS